MIARPVASAALFQPTAPAVLPDWCEADIAHPLDDGSFRLVDGRQARQAASCLLCPEPGDAVLLLQSARGLFVMAVLERSPAQARLAVPGAQAVSLQADEIELTANRELALRCLGDVELTSAAGSVSIQARHLLQSASHSLVQTARHWVSQVEQGLLQASALLHLQAEQGLITAKADLKLDAERVSLG
ncbi:DUF3540 domain-containing protein [Burkholderiaceae bacterium UC74_6]